MHKYSKILITFLSIFVGLWILLFSLISASGVFSSSQVSSGELKFYVDTTILPDNILYPAMMVVDRAKLQSASPINKIFLKIEYAFKRLEYANELLEKGQTSLAMTTLTKSAKYLNSAAVETLTVKLSSHQREQVILALEYHHSKIEPMLDRFDDQDKNILMGLLGECEILKEKLTQSLL